MAAAEEPKNKENNQDQAESWDRSIYASRVLQSLFGLIYVKAENREAVNLNLRNMIRTIQWRRAARKSSR